MREERDGFVCVLAFGPSAQEVVSTCKQRGSLPDVPFVGLGNPLPTGDHWRVIEWLSEHIRCKGVTPARMPLVRRTFLRAAADALARGGFYMELKSQAARKLRDDNGLRMQRGRVYAFVTRASKPAPDERGSDESCHVG